MHNKKIYFHIGAHKTGSTFLQKTMQANAAALNKEGIIYLGRCTSDAGRSVRKELLAKVRAFARNPSLHTLVVSDEDLSHNRNEIALKLIDGHAQRFDVTVVCYIREIVAYYISFYSFAGVFLAPLGRTPQFRNIAEYAGVQRAYASTHDLLLKAADAIGKDSIIVRPYVREHLRGESIDSDFLSIIGYRSKTFKAVESSNVSPSLLQAEQIYYLLRLTEDVTIRRRVVARIVEESNRGTATITMDELNKIYADYHDAELDVISRFLSKQQSEDVFPKTYNDWRIEAERGGNSRQLTPEQKEEIHTFIRVARDEADAGPAGRGLLPLRTLTKSTHAARRFVRTLFRRA